MNETTGNLTPAKRGRFKLLVLILIPFLLMVLAWLMFYTGVGVPQGTRNKGLLINPPIQLNDTLAQTADPIVVGNNTKWFFLLVGGTDCNELCRQRLYLTRQIRTALGKNTHKIQRLYLKDSGAQLAPELLQLIEEEHPDLLIKNIDINKFKGLLSQHSAAGSTDPAVGYYLADFRGFIMMYYGSEHSYKDTMTDVKFLLKYAP